MGNAHISLYMHYVFTTKERLPLIAPEIQDRLWHYLGGIAKQNKMKALAVGGTSDHVHILLSIPATLSISKAIQLIKGNSSKWLNDTFQPASGFSWQKGYGAFSINISIVQETIRYIQNQALHHRRKSFKEEYLEFLKKNEVDYDERYIWV